MAKTEAKTKPTEQSVEAFLAAIDDPARRDDARAVDELLRRVSGEEPRMWGPSIVGYGAYHYCYDSGREGDAPRLAFSPRKSELVIYILDQGDGETAEEEEALIDRLGKHRRGKSCLYVKRLDAIDRSALEALVERSWKRMAERYPA